VRENSIFLTNHTVLALVSVTNDRNLTTAFADEFINLGKGIFL
jgi:hypothetical protein